MHGTDGSHSRWHSTSDTPMGLALSSQVQEPGKRALVPAKPPRWLRMLWRQEAWHACDTRPQPPLSIPRSSPLPGSARVHRSAELPGALPLFLRQQRDRTGSFRYSYGAGGGMHAGTTSSPSVHRELGSQT